jgi:arylsulfatase A-like enzyme
LLPLLALLCGCSTQPPPTNLLLVSLDTLAPGRMSLYGAQRETTPHLDALARKAVVFERAFSPSSWTLPAHAAMFTGRYPTSLSPDPNDLALYGAATPLAQLFRDRGYRTGAVTGGGFVSAQLGADRGFDSFLNGGPHAGGIAPAVEWIERHADAPFFFFFHTYVVHTAYMDRRFVRELDGGRIQNLFAPFARTNHRALHGRICCGDMELSENEREFLLALYDGGVAAADEMVGELLAALSRSGVADRTTVVVTSDHGEELFEHGWAAVHGHTLYDELLRVPLLWYEAGLSAGRSQPGRRVDEAVSLIDLAPTLIARFGLEQPPDLDGVDLSPLLEHGRWEVERALFSEGVRHGPERVGVRTAEATLIRTPEPHVQRAFGERHPVPVRAPIELYRASDRHQQRDRSQAEPELARTLLRQLDRHLAQSAPERSAAPTPVLDESTRRALRELGYLE